MLSFYFSIHLSSFRALKVIIPEYIFFENLFFICLWLSTSNLYSLHCGCLHIVHFLLIVTKRASVSARTPVADRQLDGRQKGKLTVKRNER